MLSILSFSSLSQELQKAQIAGMHLDPKVTFRGAIRTDAIHGISAAAMDGDQLYMVSDWGNSIFYQSHFIRDTTDSIIGIAIDQAAAFTMDGHILGPQGFDAEGLTIQHGYAYISTESVTDEAGRLILHDAIYRVSIDPKNFGALLQRESVFDDLVNNQGIEGITYDTRSNSLHAFEEGNPAKSVHRVFINGTHQANYQSPNNLQIGDVTYSKDGCFIVLERLATGWSTPGKPAHFKIEVNYSCLDHQGDFTTYPLIQLDSKLPDNFGNFFNDNFEAVMMCQKPDGQYELVIASDDNRWHDSTDNMTGQFTTFLQFDVTLPDIWD